MKQITTQTLERLGFTKDYIDEADRDYYEVPKRYKGELFWWEYSNEAMDFFRFMLVSKESWVTKNDIWEVRLEDDEIKEPIIKDEDKISDVINGIQNLYNTLRK
jgi:hypothetical protein